VISVVASFVWGYDGFIVLALVLALLLLPVSVMLRCDAGWPRTVMMSGTALLSLLGFAAVAMAFAAPEDSVMKRLGGGAFIAFLLGSVLSQFAANWLVSIRSRR
jgi:hypothetical protein